MTDNELMQQARRQFREGVETRRAELERAGQLDDSIERVDVWIAAGLKRRWRVIDGQRTYGEWDDLGEATRFLQLLVDGNPNLQRLG